MQTLSSFFSPVYEMIFPTSTANARPQFDRPSGFWSTPSDEKLQATFSKLVHPNCQREDWYKVAPHLAEFWCTVSNIGFIYVGLKHKSIELLIAGTASAVSHAIPKQWLNTVDKIGVFLVATKFAREYQVLQQNPWLLGVGAATVVINAADAYLARNHGWTWPHVVWHLSSAALADLFLRYTKP